MRLRMGVLVVVVGLLLLLVLVVGRGLRISAQLNALARRSDRRDLLRGEGAKSLGNQVRMALDHVLPADGVHDVGGMAARWQIYGNNARYYILNVR